MSERVGIVREALGRERRAVRAALWAGLLVALCTVGLAATSAWLIVRAAQRPSVLSLTVPMGLVQLFALAKAGGRYLERTQTHRAALSAMGHVRARVAREIEPLLPAGLGPRSADVVDTILGDVERVQDLLTAVAGPLVTSVAAGLVCAVVCAAISPLAGGVLLVALGVDAVVLPLVASRRGRRSGRELDEVHSEMTTLFDQAASSGDEFVMMGAGVRLEDRLARLEERGDVAQRRRRGVNGAMSGLAVLVNGVACVVVAVVSVQGVRTGQLSAALVALPTLTTIAALELVSGLVTGVVGTSRDRAAMARLNALGDLPWPVHDGADEMQASACDEGPTYDDVSFDYDGVSVLQGVTTALHPGDVVVLSGPSGGGKTTLARLAAKFLDPRRGQVALAGVAYTSLRARDVREVVGLVDDAPHVFAATIAENLRVARSDASDEQLTRACEEAGLGDFLRSLPDGLQTPVGGAATGLSGGEQRRLGVARELLSGRPVAIFDEPTEGLDDEAARALLRSLREHYRAGVLVIISHRDARILPSAREWRIDDGRLVETKDPHATGVIRL